jgi:hypothetical protein
MRNLIHSITKLKQDRSGAIAMIAAIAIPALVAASAMAVDMATFRFTQNRLQNAADAGALAALQALDRPTAVATEAAAYAMQNVPSSFGQVTTTADVQLGIWDPVAKQFTPGGPQVDQNAVRVSAERTAARGNKVGTILMQMFGVSPDLRATAIAARQLNIQYEPPVATNLSNEAHDFNELYAYCFNHAGSGSPASRRSQMTLISNNYRTNRNVVTDSGGRITAVPANPLVWPECATGESLSFRLRNLRSAKNEWENGRRPTNITEFNHHTDTRIDRGNELYDGISGVRILETVRCDSQLLCTPGSPGSPIRQGRNRNPTFSPQPCEPGKFMYFGWEDRPPELGGSDRDYDDIRILMKCPRQGRLGDGMSRLVG